MDSRVLTGGGQSLRQQGWGGIRLFGGWTNLPADRVRQEDWSESEEEEEGEKEEGTSGGGHPVMATGSLWGQPPTSDTHTQKNLVTFSLVTTTYSTSSTNSTIHLIFQRWTLKHFSGDIMVKCVNMHMYMDISQLSAWFGCP